MKNLTKVLILIFVTVFASAGCKGNTNKQGHYDPDEQSAVFMRSRGYAQTLNGILYFAERKGNRNLIYVDLDSGESMPLCARPECLHNDDKCDAYLNYFESPELMIWNKRIFWINVGNELYSMRLDGTDRRFEKRLDKELFVNDRFGLTVIKNGRLYSCSTIGSIKNGEPISICTVYSEPISGNGSSEIIYRGEASWMYTTGTISEDSLFFTIQKKESDVYHIEFYTFSLETGKTDLLYEWSSAESYQDLSKENDTIRMSGKRGWINYEIGKRELTEYKIPGAENDSYCILDNDRCVRSTSTTTFSCFLYNGALLYEGRIKTDGVDLEKNGRSPLGFYNGKVLYYLSNWEEGEADSIISVDPLNGEAKVLWRGENGGN